MGIHERSLHDFAIEIAKKRGAPEEVTARAVVMLAADAMREAKEQAAKVPAETETRPLVYADLTGAWPDERVGKAKDWELRLPWQAATAPAAMMGLAVALGLSLWSGLAVIAAPYTVPAANVVLAMGRRWLERRRVLRSATVEKADFEIRQEICGQCPDAEVDLVRFGPSERFCGRCGCGRRWGARLSRKNRYSGWRCPAGRFPGIYGDEGQRIALVSLGYDNAGDRLIPATTKGAMQQPKKGCGGGCNGGKA